MDSSKRQTNWSGYGLVTQIVSISFLLNTDLNRANQGVVYYLVTVDLVNADQNRVNQVSSHPGSVDLVTDELVTFDQFTLYQITANQVSKNQITAYVNKWCLQEKLKVTELVTADQVSANQVIVDLVNGNLVVDLQVSEVIGSDLVTFEWVSVVQVTDDQMFLKVICFKSFSIIIKHHNCIDRTMAEFY